MKKFLLKLGLLFIISFQFIVFGYSQEAAIAWESCFGGSEYEYVKDIVQAGNYNYILASTESNDGGVTNNHGGQDIWLVKTDLSGNLVFEKCFGGSRGDGASNLLKVSDSVFYIYGATNSSDGDISHNPDTLLFSYWIIKIDDNGNIIWEKTFGGSGREEPRDAIVTNDGGILAMGLTTSSDGDISNYYGFGDVWMIKVNAQGEKQWDFTLGSIAFEEAGSVIQTSDGGYMVGATTVGGGGGNFDTLCNYHGLPVSYADIWLVKLDSLRNIEWQQCYGGTYGEGCGDIKELPDGYIVVGYSLSNDGDVSGNHGTPSPTNFEFDIWVFKINFSGNILWQKCLGGYSAEYCRNIFLTSDGGYMVVGSTTSNNGDVVGYHGEGIGLWGDIWFVKLSPEGELQWQYCYGGNGDERVYHGVIQKGDFNYVLAIETDTDPWQCGGPMWFDVRAFEIDFTITSVFENGTGNLTAKLVVTPNPASDLLKIKLSENTEGDELVLYNTNGQAVKSTQIQPYEREYEFTVSSLHAGLYIVVLLEDGRVVGKEKVVVSH